MVTGHLKNWGVSHLEVHPHLKIWACFKIYSCFTEGLFILHTEHLIRVRWRKECKWKNDPTEYNLNASCQQRRHVDNSIKQAHWSLYIEKLLEDRSNFKEIFTITNKLLGRNEPLPLPPIDDLGILAQEFNDFFWDKIDNIMLQLQPTPGCPTDNRCMEDRFLMQHCIHKFCEVRDEEVLELLTKSPAKSCDLDPLLSKLLVQHH